MPLLNVKMTKNDMDDDGETGIATAQKSKTKLPKRYKVLIHNDDYTTMEFVVMVLIKIFHKTPEDAEHIMLKVHKEGIGVCGVYTYEVAESKAEKVKGLARESGHPLKCTVESE